MTRATTQAISPFFIVSNVEQSIAFYRDKLGFETRFQQPDRNPFSAIIGRDGAQILSSPSKTCRHCRTPSVIPTCGGMPSSMWKTPMRSPRNLPIASPNIELPMVAQPSACPQGHQRRSPRLRDLRPGRLRLVLRQTEEHSRHDERYTR